MKPRINSVVRSLGSILHGSIKARLITIVVLSQVLLAVGLLFSGVFYTRQRLLSTLDAGMQARAMSVAALVRYSEDASGNVYFDDSLMPLSLDPAHPDLFAVLLSRAEQRFAGAPIALPLLPRQPLLPATPSAFAEQEQQFMAQLRRWRRAVDAYGDLAT